MFYLQYTKHFTRVSLMTARSTTTLYIDTGLRANRNEFDPQDTKYANYAHPGTSSTLGAHVLCNPQQKGKW